MLYTWTILLFFVKNLQNEKRNKEVFCFFVYVFADACGKRRMTGFIYPNSHPGAMVLCSSLAGIVVISKLHPFVRVFHYTMIFIGV